MKETYCLKDPDGYIIGMIEIDKCNHAYVDGNCYEFNSWYDDKEPCDKKYLAGFCCKWDSCTHWYFRGDDFDPEIENCDGDGDGYYHLCGCRSFTNHIRLMCFVWKIVAMVLVRENRNCKLCDNSEYIMKEAYFKTDTVKTLVEFMLNGYEIMEVKGEK